MTATDGSRYEGGPLIIQVAESADPPVVASLAATAANDEAWTATFGLSLEMLSARSFTIEIQRRPLRAGSGVVARGPGDPAVPVRKGSLQIRLGEGRTFRGSASLEPEQASANLYGDYELSCWVRPETLGLRPNGERPAGAVERVEDESFRSAFCKRVAHLR